MAMAQWIYVPSLKSCLRLVPSVPQHPVIVTSLGGLIAALDCVVSALERWRKRRDASVRAPAGIRRLQPPSE